MDTYGLGNYVNWYITFKITSSDIENLCNPNLENQTNIIYQMIRLLETTQICIFL